MEAGFRQYRSCMDLSQCGTFQDGVYCSQWFRGLEAEMEWLRLTLEGRESLLVRVYVSDACPEKFSGPGSRQPVMERRNRDLLLYGVRGNYLCFTVEPADALQAFRLEFPGRSIDQGLPSVLQRDETLRRLLGVYQSRYMDLNREAAGFPDRLNPESEKCLPQLARWLGASQWTENSDLTREILLKACELTRYRGTRKGLSILAELVTGSQCRIVEAFQIRKWEQEQNRRSEYEEYVDRNAESVTILIPPQVPRARADQLRNLLPDFVPLGVSCRMVHLLNDSVMDSKSYLDENAALKGNMICRLDGRAQEAVLLE